MAASDKSAAKSTTAPHGSKYDIFAWTHYYRHGQVVIEHISRAEFMRTYGEPFCEYKHRCYDPDRNLVVYLLRVYRVDADPPTQPYKKTYALHVELGAFRRIMREYDSAEYVTTVVKTIGNAVVKCDDFDDRHLLWYS